MAASPISDHRPSRERFARLGRRGDPGDHQGDRCQMCGQRVMVDAQGRCQLGHQVLPRAQMAARIADRDARREDVGAEDEDVVASYSEPRTGFGPVVLVGASVTEEIRTVEPVREPEDLPLRIPDRLRNPLPASTPPPAHARTLFSDQHVTDQHVTDEIALPVADAPNGDNTPAGRTSPRFAEADTRHWVDTSTAGTSPLRSALEPEPVTTTAGLKAAVQTADLTPTAASVLDVEPSDWHQDWASGGPESSEERYEDTPAPNTDWTDVAEDDDLEPPRSWATRIAGALFVLALLGVAWYLAVTI